MAIVFMWYILTMSSSSEKGSLRLVFESPVRSGFLLLQARPGLGPVLIYSHCPKDRTATGKDRTRKRLRSWTGRQPVQTGLILYNILSSMVGVRLTNVWFSCKKTPAIHNLMIGGVSCQKTRHS